MKRFDFITEWKTKYGRMTRDFCFISDMRMLRATDVTQYADGRVHVTPVSRDLSQHYRIFGIQTLLKSKLSELKGTISLPCPYDKYKLPKTALVDACGDNGMLIDHTLGRVYQIPARGLTYPPGSNEPTIFIPWKIYAADKEYKVAMQAYLHKLIQLYNVTSQLETMPVPCFGDYGSYQSQSTYTRTITLINLFEEGYDAEQVWATAEHLRPEIFWLKKKPSQTLTYREARFHAMIQSKALPQHLKRPIEVDYLIYRS